MIRRPGFAIALFVAGCLSLSACAAEAPPPAAEDEAPTSAETPSPETTPDDPNGPSDDEFDKSGVVMLLESQLGTFGGTGRWDGDTLIMSFDDELDGGDGLDHAFVCGFMNGLVREQHSTAVETPSGTTDCAT